LLRESGIEMSFVRSGHAGTRTIRLALLSAAYAETTQLSATDALTQADEVNAQFGLTSPLPVDPSRPRGSRQLAQPVSDARETLAQPADANSVSFIDPDANSTSGVLMQAADTFLDTIAPTASDTLTQTAVSDEAATAAEALTQVAPTPLTFEQHIVRWLDEHPEPSEPGRCAYCGEMETRGRPVVPFETAPSTHAWLHSGCWRAWRGQRRFRAVMVVGGGKLSG
jgi:hypothetical protein